ncbi:uncharacterized protein YcfL [Paenibacillus sp. PastF-3]|uniref:hypothetical protein n=1 Tax=unclassified Paenibacillus TaxID=185978 RepID=UPI00247463EF|nr:hypothetical protein [Paenibacillus sp. PastF-3]MDH6374298.1 uncharacterized protein YcfL [Paenibacillus sp. PastF-3]
MRKIQLMSLILVLFFLSACSSKEEVKTTYIDATAYQGAQQDVLSVVNQRVEYFNKRDKDLYASVFTKDSSQSDIEAYEKDKTRIMKLSAPKFMSESENQITVSIHEEYKDSPYGSVGDTMYTLMKVDGAWKINGID